MPKAEVGSTKYIANKMKAKGLQRLRWYCQTCEKQCRDENGFKQHTMSEGHVRSMLLIGEDPKKYINEYSNQFKRDFLQLLKTAHGEKKVHMNNFYQEYIRDKEHIHMNSTKWPSLTEFAKYLGKEGICRVEEGDRGLEIQWIDVSPEAISRREDVKRKERLAKGDETLEARMLEKQIKQAREAAEKAGKFTQAKEATTESQKVISTEPTKVSLTLGSKTAPSARERQKEQAPDAPVAIESFSTSDLPSGAAGGEQDLVPKDDNDEKDENQNTTSQPAFSLGISKSKKINPLAARKNPFAKKKVSSAPEPEKKMSNAERIMKEELERKRVAEQRGFAKRQRTN